MKKALLIALGAVGMVVVACKKDDNGKSATTAQLLTSTTWKYDTVALDLDKDGTSDSNVPPGYILPCDLDNTITFNSDMTGVSDEGPTKCADSLGQSTSFTWSLKNNDSTLSIQGNSQADLNGDITIKEVTNTRLVLIKNVVFTSPIVVNTNVIVSLKK